MRKSTGVCVIILTLLGGATVNAQDAEKKLNPVQVEIDKLKAQIEQLRKDVISLSNRKVRLEACSYPTEFTHEAIGNGGEVIENA